MMLYRQHNTPSQGHARRRFNYGCFLFFLLLASLGCSTTPATPPDQLAPITAADSRLFAGGSAFEVRGVNYIHSSNADLTKCAALQFGADANCPFETAPIAADFDKLRGLG